MRILIDGDRCSVLRVAASLARRHGIECIAIANECRNPDTSIKVSWITVPVTYSSVDFEILDRIECGDIVVTDDFALAFECGERGATPVQNSGRLYTFCTLSGGHSKRFSPRGEMWTKKELRRRRETLFELRLSSIIEHIRCMDERMAFTPNKQAKREERNLQREVNLIERKLKRTRKRS
jgi:uncharacterized protein YaiI (UPF0178 family)